MNKIITHHSIRLKNSEDYLPPVFNSRMALYIFCEMLHPVRDASLGRKAMPAPAPHPVRDATKHQQMK